jgi:hypothetical protein
VLLVLLAVGPLQPATAAGRFSAVITSIDPALPTSGSTINLTVLLANSTADAVTGIHAHFILSLSPLRGRSQIPDVLAGRALPAYRTASDEVASGIDLASGASTSLTLQATAADLGLRSARPGVYVLGLLVAGVTGGNHSVSQRPLTLLPWLPSHTGKGLGLTTVWSITAPPSRGVDGIFFDDSLAVSLATGGRLRTQLDDMRQVPGALWAIDPLLIEDVQALAAGARILQEGGVRAATDVEMHNASQWLADLQGAAATGSRAALPLADLDVRGALLLGHNAIVSNAVGTAAQRLSAALGETVTDVAVPVYGGALTDKQWRYLDSLGARIALVEDSAYPAEQQQYTPTTALSVTTFNGPLLVVDGSVSDAPIRTGSAPRQAFAAELLMTYLEQPNSDRVVTVAVPPEWQASTGAQLGPVLNAPWLRHTGVIAAEGAGSEPRATTHTALTKTQLQRNGNLRHALSEQRMLLQLTADPAFAATISDAVIGVLSRWWTGRTVADAYAPDVTRQLSALAGSVRVVTRGDIVFGGQKGDVPVTIENGLPVPVDIGVRAIGLPTVRVTPRPYTAIHLNAGKRVSVEIPTQVTGSGDAYLSLQVVASDSGAVGTPVLLTVRSAAYARVASYVVAIAFAALLLLIGANTVRRVRNRNLGKDDEE